MIIFTKHEIADFIGNGKHVNKTVLDEVLKENDIKDRRALEVLYAKATQSDLPFSFSDRHTFKTMIKKVQNDYDKALKRYEIEQERQHDLYRLSKRRTEQMMPSLIRDIEKLADKYSKMVGEDDYLPTDEPVAGRHEILAMRNIIQLARDKQVPER